MPLLTVLLSNWRLFVAVGLLWAGWYSHGVWDGYRAHKTEIKAVDNLGKGEVAVVDFNSAIDKAKVNAKDDCINRDMPVSFIRLLK